VIAMAYAVRIRLDDKVSSIFQPDILAEDEYAKTLQRKQHFTPEEQLMLAVLEDAVFCFQKYLSAQDRKGRALFQEAEEWILDENDEWFFSFNNICEVLRVDPNYLRQGLLTWKKQQSASHHSLKTKKVAPRNHMVPYR
jgi:hypothetical protein